MGQEETKLDLTQGIPAESLADGQMLVGHAQGEAVLAVRVEQKVFAVSPHCTHYNGPLAEGLVVGDAPGITPVSTCARERLSEPQPLVPSRAGRWSYETG